MNVFLKFGSHATELNSVKSQIADATNLEFEARESSYWGGDYYLARFDGHTLRTIKIHLNWDVVGQEPIFPEFSEYGVLIHCDYVLDEDKLLSSLRTLGLEVIDRTTS